MSLVMVGIGTAVPEHRIAQSDAAGLAISFANAAPGRERALAAVYRQSGIRTRGSVLLEATIDEPFVQRFFPPAEAGGDRPSTGARMKRYAVEAGRLAAQAAATAIESAGMAVDEITHLVSCSCTGFANPGVDLELVRTLGLPASVARTHIGFMGCHDAFNALRVADAFVTANPSAVALVSCVELCSLHLQYGSHGDHVVANSLFADGAAAVVGVGCGHSAAWLGGWRIVAQASEVLPDSEQEMGWLIGDSGFEMTLSPRVPGLIASQLRPAVEEMLARAGIAAGDVATWAVHPGGPRILGGVAEAMGLPPDTLWLTSPLQRAMQTLLLACPHAHLLGSDGGDAGGSGSSGGSSNAENSSAAPNGAGPQPPNVVVLHTITEKVGEPSAGLPGSLVFANIDVRTACLRAMGCQYVARQKKHGRRKSQNPHCCLLLFASCPSPLPAAGLHVRRHRAPRQRAAQALSPAGGPAERAAGAVVALPPRQAQLRAAKVLWQPREQGPGRGE